MLTTKEVEEQIKDYPLKFIPVRDQRVEWKIKLPMYVDTFNLMIKENNRIPSQDEFVERYFQDNAAKVANVISNSQLKKGLEARLRRTYPSFVRDVHFGALLRERGLDVSYGRDLDVCGGVDHIIKYRGQTFHIHCYVSTRRGRMGRRIKNKRHDFRGIHLNVEMDLGRESAKSVGDFYLYSDKHVDHIIEKMEQSLKRQNE